MNILILGSGGREHAFAVKLHQSPLCDALYIAPGNGGTHTVATNVAISPIADLMKSEVYKLGEYLQIPQSILKAKPSDGLFGDDRSDEDQLKASYDELEWAMLQTEQGKKAEDFSGREREVFEIYTRLNRANQHKMQPIPICKISR